jgi:lipooligosaccharide transport system permease protein
MSDVRPPVPVPSLARRLGAVWWRHVRVYSSSLVSNAIPPFMEPLIFLAGIGLGLGKYIVSMDGLPYIQFLAVGLVLTSAMYTASFENTFGTFIRLEFDKVYDGMQAASLTAADLMWGELLFTATKGAFFAGAVLTILSCFGLVTTPWMLLGIPLGFLTAGMFGALAMLVTSFVSNINHFNFYFTLFISPLFFFSGVVFPLSQLPEGLRWVAGLMPLTHPIELMRLASGGHSLFGPAVNLVYILVFAGGVGTLAVGRMRKRLVT